MHSVPQLAELKQGPACYVNFPVELLDDLQFLRDDTTCKSCGVLSLTEEFWYNDTDLQCDSADESDCEAGRIRYRAPAPCSREESSWRYARLFTATSHQRDLARFATSTSCTAAGLGFQFSHALAVLQTPMLWDSSWDSQDLCLLALPCLIVVRLIIMLGIGLSQAKTKIDTDPGDWVTSVAWVDWVWSWWSAALMYAFSVPASLRDQIVMLHVRKPNQPVAVFKADRKRAFVVGWDSKDHYVAEENQGQLGRSIAGVMCEALAVVLLVFAFVHTGSLTVTAVFSFLWSCAWALRHGYDLLKLYQARQHFHRWLTDNSGEQVWKKLARDAGDAQAEKKATQAEKKVFTCHRLLRQHFGEAPPKEIADAAAKENFKI